MLWMEYDENLIYHALLLTDLLTTDCTPGFHIDANVSTDITILIIITKTWIDKYRYHKNHHQSNFCDIHFCEFAFPEKHANFIFENWQFLGLFQFFSGYELKLCNFLHRAKSSGVRLPPPPPTPSGSHCGLALRNEDFGKTNNCFNFCDILNS